MSPSLSPRHSIQVSLKVDTVSDISLIFVVASRRLRVSLTELLNWVRRFKLGSFGNENVIIRCDKKWSEWLIFLLLRNVKTMVCSRVFRTSKDG